MIDKILYLNKVRDKFQFVENQLSFENILVEIYENLFEDLDREEFNKKIISIFYEIYGSNLRKAGYKFLELMKETLNKNDYERQKYFQTTLDVLLKKKETMLHFSDIEKEVNRLIGELENKSLIKKNTHYDICGGLIYGSYARGNYHPESDLDLILLTRNADYISYKIGIWTIFVNFREILAKRIGMRTDSAAECVMWKDKSRLNYFSNEYSLTKSNILVISPFKIIKKYAERTIEKAKTMSST